MIRTAIIPVVAYRKLNKYVMKKLFTLAAGIFATIAVFAADRNPVITVTSTKNFKVVIDGKTFFPGNYPDRLTGLHNGRHTIRVYEMRRGLFVKRERLVASSSFRTRGHDVRIMIDHFGKIRIQEIKRDGRFNRFDDNRRNKNRRF